MSEGLRSEALRSETLPTYHFDGYTLRPAVAEDLALARAWTMGDPDHRDTTQPWFWAEQSMTANSFLLLDAKGPVFFFKVVSRAVSEHEKWAEAHIQFCDTCALTQARTRRGVVQGFAWLKKMLEAGGFGGLYFYSSNPQLIYFCTNRLGFTWDGKKIVYKVSTDGQVERTQTQRAA